MISSTLRYRLVLTASVVIPGPNNAGLYTYTVPHQMISLVSPITPSLYHKYGIIGGHVEKTTIKALSVNKLLQLDHF